MPMITARKISAGEKEKLLESIGYYDPKWIRCEMPEHLKDYFADLMTHNQFYEFQLKLFRNTPKGKKFFLCFEIVSPLSDKSLILATVPVASSFDSPRNLPALWLECRERIEIAFNLMWLDREEREICTRYEGMRYKAEYKKYSVKKGNPKNRP